MDDLIEALQIFRKYTATDYPTHCEHDVLTICGVEPDDVSQEDKERLSQLGFIVGSPFGEDSFISYRFGSC